MRKNKIQILLFIFITVFTTGLIQPSLLEAEEYDFKEVEIGSTKTIPVNITSTGPGFITITKLEFDPIGCTDFSVVSAPALGSPPAVTIVIEVGFTPLEIGSCSNTLKVEAIGTPPEYLTLTGTGVEAISDQPEPFNISRPYLKVTICHIPPGNPSKEKTLSISEAALEAHLDHGDYLGACDD
jgi:hypothetical protein